MFCLPISTFMYLWAIYIFSGLVCLFCCSQIGRPILGIYQSHTDRWMYCRDWERGHAVLFLGKHKSDFRYSAEAKLMFFFFHVIPTQRPHTYTQNFGIFVRPSVLPWRGAWCRPSTWPSMPSAPPAEPCPVQATQSACHNPCFSSIYRLTEFFWWPLLVPLTTATHDAGFTRGNENSDEKHPTS